MKDFLFFTYSFVDNANLYFKSFEKAGYSCDYVDENTLESFFPEHQYRCVVRYLHCANTLSKTNSLINNEFRDALLVQHDDTDHENVQQWTHYNPQGGLVDPIGRPPDLIMQREYCAETKNPYACPIYPFHFPIPSVYDPSITEKEYDVCFMANITNQRRVPFIKRVLELSKTTMSDLRWFIDITGVGGAGRTTNMRQILNKSKIGLHYFGNSNDSIRIWEIASCKTALLMPKMKSFSVASDYMPFDEYEVMKDDFSDLEEKIRFLLENDRYAEQAERTQEEYLLNHAPEKCCEYYQEIVLKHLQAKEEK